MPHQWMEGNLPVSAKCSVCDKTCGSVLRWILPPYKIFVFFFSFGTSSTSRPVFCLLFTFVFFFSFFLLSQWWRRLQDWRCLWCRAMVHTACRPQYPVRCPLGPCRVSIVPPTALHSVGAYTHGYYDGRRKSKQKGKLGQIHTQHARFACPRLICTDTHANMATTPLIVVKKKKKKWLKEEWGGYRVSLLRAKDCFCLKSRGNKSITVTSPGDLNWLSTGVGQGERHMKIQIRWLREGRAFY